MSSDTFSTPSSSAYQWTAPSAQTITIKITGPGGGAASEDTQDYSPSGGGNGGYIEAEYDVADGETIEIYVGGGGKATDGDTGSGGSGGVGRYSGGSGAYTSGSGQYGAGGGGGGSSEVLTPSGTIIAASGGGGGGGVGIVYGGGGAQGGSAGGSATSGSGWLSFGGQGNLSAGGDGSTYVNAGTQVTATNGSGASGGTATEDSPGTDGADGQVVIEYTEPQPPSAPSSLSANATGNDIDLEWADNSDDEDGFYIYRSTSSGSTKSDYTQIDSVDSNTTTYVDSDLADDTYYYRVSAYNSAGESGLSNEESTTVDTGWPIYIDGEQVKEITIDGNVVTDVTIDGDSI